MSLLSGSCPPKNPSRSNPSSDSNSSANRGTSNNVDPGNPDEPDPTPNLKAPAATFDPFQVAAQKYPWMYMTSTLDGCFLFAPFRTVSYSIGRTQNHLKICLEELDEEQERTSNPQVSMRRRERLNFTMSLCRSYSLGDIST